MEWIYSAEAWISLLTLTFLEIVLGVDNIIFVTLAVNKLPENQQKKATNIGLLLAMFMRIALLLGINILIGMKKPWLSFNFGWASGGFTGQSLILITGGIFLLYKSVSEIHQKLEGDEHTEAATSTKSTMGAAIIQITLINIIFSFDSILTAVGMTNGIPGALILMIIAVVLSVVIMMLFTHSIGKFINKHPTMQILGLSFLILIGFMLIVEGAHLADVRFGTSEVGTVPKGYLYFAIAFSLLVEMLNLKMRAKRKEVAKLSNRSGLV